MPSKKGIPFDPLETRYLVITEVSADTSNKKLRRSNYRVPEDFVPVQINKRLTNRKIKVGSRVKLPKTHFFAALLLRNEILGCTGQASDREFLLRNLRAEYPDWSAKASRLFINRFSERRSLYLRGQLYSGQPLPPLYCFYWDKDGYIQHPKLHKQRLSFQFCKRYLTSERFADPRFFPDHELAQLRTLHEQGAKEWHVPAIAEIHRIEAEIQRPLYNSITFPPGFGKEHNPL